ncbi:MobF family relaxase [Pseudonocardia broussonetiae]|uniref:Relaxase domain-containing protein n=1 Tax=Pseudonocardia broussonetiae TaxID=2736640 RepID=A0A6M6JDJ0_9PSEU|nr:MobF family relaxase [Pseudonocardia broussonetiae]QJY45130.1 relaxase domain-containing protein [Pseudonocardia broussonetiae]
MLSIATGHSVRYLTDAVATGRENYYTGAVAAGEPPGRWYGAGAEMLGLEGEVDPHVMEALYSHLRDPRDPRSHSPETWDEADQLAPGHRRYRSADEVYAGLLEAHPGAGPEQRAELRTQAERSARQAVSFLDVTFSAPKSVTVLAVAFERAATEARAAGDEEAAQAWEAHAQAVEEAVMAGARAAIDYLQDEAGYSRVGHHGGGAGRWVDGHEFVVAQFLQHDSRDKDPQLHVHQGILNRVPCADGTWRTLDSRAIHALRGAAGAIGERVMEAHMTRSLGVEFATRPDGRAREVLGVSPEVMDLFSSRRKAVTGRTAEMLTEFRHTYGREPSSAERFYIARQATLATRAAKSHEGETRAEQLARWTEQCAESIGTGLGQVAHDVRVRAQQASDAAEWSVQDVVDRALAGVSETKQAWTRSSLMRAVSDALPGNLRLPPEDIRPLLDGLTDAALDGAVPVTRPGDTTNLPASELLADGRSPYTAPAVALFTTEGQVSAEHALRAALVRRGAARFTPDAAGAVVARFATSGRPLGVDQAAALRGVLTSGAQVEVLSAAPGTGKSFVVGALSEAWVGVDERRVFGLTPSQVAAGVLAEEGVTVATNTAAWLGAQVRLAAGGPVSRTDERWRLRRDDLVVVDEANMAGTDQLADIQARCAQAGAKLLLVGDPRQLGAVGPGGALADVAKHGIRYELAEVRRFSAEWERAASLRLRDGDPDVLAEYGKHGRLREGGTAEQAETAASRAWLADTLAGRESLLMVRDNEAAARVSAALRAELVSLGRVDEAGVPLGREGWEGVTAGVGDLVQARRNGWELIGVDGNTRAPINRDTYRVTALRPDGGLTVAPVVGRGPDGEVLGDPLALPASYIAADLTLGYASTAHAAEGRTVDTAHCVPGAGTDLPGLLVPMTRGRESNTAWVVTTATPPDAATGETFDVEPRSAAAVLADVLDGYERERSALAVREQADIAARSTMTHVEQLADIVARTVTAGRTAATLDRLTADGAITPDQRAALAADEAFGSLERLLRTAELAGHDPDVVLSGVLADRDLTGARSPAQVLHSRITSAYAGRLTPHLTTMSDLIPSRVPEEWAAWLTDRAEAADARRHELGFQAAEQPPRWALDALGPVPADDDVLARQEWEHRAGWAAAYRELAGHTDDLDPLGHAPAPGLAEKAAVYRAAHEALGLLDVGAEEADLTDGQLRARYVAYAREETWAPRDVADELDATHQAAAKARTDAELWAARADAPGLDEADAVRLRADAAAAAREAEQLAARAAVLEDADQARGRWFVHTAVTRDNAHRAGTELRARGIDPDHPTDRITADEWLALHRAEEADADRDREIRDEHELYGSDIERIADPADAAETAVPDVRDLSTAHPSERTDRAERRRIPTIDETAEAVARAQLALAEITARTEAENRGVARDAEFEQIVELARHAEPVAEVDDSDELSRYR